MTLIHSDIMDINKPKIAVVTCAYIPSGKIEFATPIRSVVNTDFYLHYDEDKYETFKFMLACHKHYNPGIDYDFYVIDNSSPDESIKYIKKYCEENNINFEKRDNLGFSYGAFRWAFYKYCDKYDYFVFHEQDFAPAKDGWLKEMLEFFTSGENVGAIGNHVEGPRSRANAEAEGVFKLYPEIEGAFFNLDQISLIKTSIMKECIEKHGWKLADCKDGESGEAVTNELSFVMPLFLSGYKFRGFLTERKHIATNGVCVMDEKPWEINLPDSQVAPMVLVHTRKFHPRFKRLFNWYNE